MLYDAEIIVGENWFMNVVEGDDRYIRIEKERFASFNFALKEGPQGDGDRIEKCRAGTFL